MKTKELKFDYIWFWKVKLPERKGQPCRVLARGKMNSILVEFEDRFKVITSRFAVRKRKLFEEKFNCLFPHLYKIE